jgi:hypothetical protein
MRNFPEEKSHHGTHVCWAIFLPLHVRTNPNFGFPQVQALSMDHHSPQP